MEEIEQEWLPNAIAIGISYNDFYYMNPKRINIYSKGYKQKLENQREYDNFLAYLHGVYVRDALASTVGNMFNKKGAKPIEYPSEPYNLNKSERVATEDEMELQRQAFWNSLFVMKDNFERNKEGVEQ